MNDKNVIEVLIDGQVFKLIADESEEYIQSIANYINRKILEIQDNTKTATMNSHLRSLSISINIADELLKERLENKKLAKEMEVYFAEITRLESENHILKQHVKSAQNDFEKVSHKNETLERENEKVKEELNSYIETFEEKSNHKR